MAQSQMSRGETAATEATRKLPPPLSYTSRLCINTNLIASERTPVGNTNLSLTIPQAYEHTSVRWTTVDEQSFPGMENPLTPRIHWRQDLDRASRVQKMLFITCRFKFQSIFYDS